MADVFISYSRQNVEFTEQLFAAFEERGISAWVDWQNIPRSAGWWDEIKRGIDAASTFVFLVSDASLRSPVCTLELAHARENGKRIIPVTIEQPDFDAPIPVRPDDELFQQMLAGRDLFALARELRTLLRERNWVSFVERDGTSLRGDDPTIVAALLETINTDLDHSFRHARLLVRAREWDNGRRSDDLLLFGEEIDNAEEWLGVADAQSKEPHPTALQRAYIKTSRATENRRKRLARSAQASIAALVIALVIGGAAALGIVISTQQAADNIQATSEQNVAQANARVTEAQGEAAQANTQVAFALGTATEIPPTLTRAAEDVALREFEAATANANADSAATQAAENEAIAGTQQANAAVANEQAATANADVVIAQGTATQIPPTLTQAAIIVADAEIEQEVSSTFAQSSLNLNEGRIDESVVMMQELVLRYPDSASAFLSLGLIYANLPGGEQLAIDAYSRAIELDPEYGLAYSNRGVVYAAIGDYDRAIADYTQAITADPELATAYNNRGVAYEAAGEFELALADYSRAIEIEPYYTFYRHRGDLYVELGQYEEAIDDLNQSIELYQRFSTAYTSRGIAYMHLGEYELAFADFNRAIELDDSDFNNFYNRGLAYTTTGEYELAVADFSLSIELNPEYLDAYYDRGTTYVYMEEYALAIADFDYVLEVDPTYVRAYTNRGIAYKEIGNYELAFANYELAIAQDPAHASAYYNRGVAYAELEEYELAITEYGKAINLDDQNAVFYRARAIAHRNLGNYAESILDYTAVLQLQPNDPQSYVNRGIAYGYAEEYDLAIADFDQAIELDLTNATAYASRAIAYYYRGSQSTSDAARADLLQAVRDWREAERLGFALSDQVLNIIASIEAEYGTPTPVPGA